MKISYLHLIKYINSRPSISELSEKLFQLGHENQIQNEILDIEFTPNRGDCLSINGILRDLSVFYDIDFNPHIYEGELKPLNIDFYNGYEEACPKISFLKIEINNDISPYKDYLNSYFLDLGINKTNFFTDVSNYISYEMGQPTHCYDATKINGGISFKKLSHDISFETLLGNSIDLRDDNAVFMMNEKVINLAGVMGGRNTACSTATSSAIIECAYFKPELIIGKTVKYDVISDAAYKFERGVDPQIHERVLRRFISIVEDHTKINRVEFVSKEFKDLSKRHLKSDFNIVNKILGTNIKKADYETYLLKLGFEVEDSKIVIPSHRADIKNQNDLAEEVARIIGYDNIIPSEIFVEKSTTITKNPINNLKSFLVDKGFYEVINQPFSEESSSTSIQVDNPLDTKKKYLRTNLRNSLTKNLLYNERRQKDSIKLFEISDIYSNSQPLNKRKVLGIIVSGRVGKNYKDFSKKIDDKFLLETLNQVFDKEDLSVIDISRDNLDSKSKNKIYYCEIHLENLPNSIKEYVPKTNFPSSFKIYEQISELPSSVRDLSFSIEDFSKFSELDSFIGNYTSPLLKDFFIFDYYKNTMNSEIKIGYRFIFQSKTKTLKDSEVDLIINDIIAHCLKIKSISIPGLNK